MIIIIIVIIIISNFDIVIGISINYIETIQVTVTTMFKSRCFGF